MTGDRAPGDDFRSRLAHIPAISDAPVDQDWVHNRPFPARQSTPDDDRGGFEPEPAEAVVEDPRYVVEDPRYYEPDVVDAPQEAWVDPEPIEPRRRRWPVFVLGLLIGVALVAAIPTYLSWRAFNSIERVPVGDTLAAASTGRNILIVGTDSRAGIDGQTQNAGNILGEGISGERSDTIMVLHLGDDGTRSMLSIPRDLWLPINGGSPQRINTAIAQGPAALVSTIRSELGIPVGNYVEVDLAGFIDVVDAVGGVTITIPHPAFDRASGLDLPTAGEVRLDSTQALAYVRSRRYTEIIDGSERPDPTSDLGRVKRQQTFLRALIDEVFSERNPLTANEVMNSTADAVRLDDQAEFAEMIGLALELRGGLPESQELPTTGASIGGRSVLLLAPGADTVLAGFR